MDSYMRYYWHLDSVTVCKIQWYDNLGRLDLKAQDTVNWVNLSRSDADQCLYGILPRNSMNAALSCQ